MSGNNSNIESPKNQETIKTNLEREGGILQNIKYLSEAAGKKQISKDMYAQKREELKNWINEQYDIVDRAKADGIKLDTKKLDTASVQFRELPKPSEYSPQPGAGEIKNEPPKPEELGALKPNSDFRDIPLNGMQLAGIEPQRLLAKSSTCEYFLVAIPGAGWGIMRINFADSSDEIAFLGLNSNFDGEQLVQMIRGAEATGGFRDVEIDGSKGTWRDVSAQTVAGAGVGAGAGLGAGAIAAIPTGGLSLPVLGGIGGALGGIGGAISGTFTDEDFTPADLGKFGLQKKFEAIRTNPKE